MTLQHTNNSNSQQQEPATESSKASGWNIVGRYKTTTGQIGVEIRASVASGRLSYTGKWGAGSGHGAEQMARFVRQMLAGRRGVVVDIPFDGVQSRAALGEFEAVIGGEA